MPRKTITVKGETWKELQSLKLKLEMGTINNVIVLLINNFKKMKGGDLKNGI